MTREKLKVKVVFIKYILFLLILIDCFFVHIYRKLKIFPFYYISYQEIVNVLLIAQYGGLILHNSANNYLFKFNDRNTRKKLSNIFKVNNEDKINVLVSINVLLVSLLSTFDIFHTLF